MNKFYYYNPVEIIFGKNSLYSIKSITKEKRVLLITSKGFKKRGVIKKLKNLINIVQIIDDIKPNPNLTYLKNIYKKIDYSSFNIIVGLGGGSVIDTAKVLSVSIKENNFDNLELIITKKAKIAYLLKPIIAIPTTSGTGSEVTPWATVWDDINKKKHSLYLKDLWCKYCILDPTLTITLPKEITIYTALDAFSHSLESIWNKNCSPITIENAISSIKIIFKNLPLVTEKLDDLYYREKLMYASLKAGLAFSNTQTAIAHSISYYLTLNHNVPHGLACSFMIPDIIDSIIGKYDYIDEAILNIFGELNSKKLRELYKKLNISTNIKDYGINLSNIDKLKESICFTSRINNSLIDIDKIFDKFKDDLI